MNRKLAWLGLVVVLLGAVAMAGPIYGFTTIAADRGVSVSVAEDSEAYLGIENVENPAIEDGGPPNDREGVVTLLYDNSNGFDEITVELVETDADEGFDLDVDESDEADFDVTVVCEDSDEEGEHTITFDLTADGDPSVQVEWTTEPVDFNCGGGGPPGGGGGGPPGGGGGGGPP